MIISCPPLQPPLSRPPSVFLLLVLVLVTLLTMAGTCAEASCLNPRLCCDGKDNTCRRDGPRISNNDSFTCFCDSVCHHLGDCCNDYIAVCQAMDCIIDEVWSEWSDCDVKCGTGNRTRRKKIIQEPMNGGKECHETMTENVTCHGNDCHHHHHHRDDFDDNEAKETETNSSSFAIHQIKRDDMTEIAKIVPLSIHSRYEEEEEEEEEEEDDDDEKESKQDQRNDNNPLKRSRDDGDESENPYFGQFELTDVRSACLLSTDWPHRLARGMTVCVDCSALAMRRRLAGHCKGHGILLTETRWVVLTIPGCHGRWMLKEEHVSGSCSHDTKAPHRQNFIFV